MMMLFDFNGLLGPGADGSVSRPPVPIAMTRTGYRLKARTLFMGLIAFFLLFNFLFLFC